MAFKKALRVLVRLKIAMSGTSGSGKTYSALRVASGIAKKCGGGIAFISTEKTRSLYYADKFDYDVLELEDYSPESYIKAIDEAIDAGYSVIIIDSMSHGWQWLNDVHSKMPGNSFQNWGKLKPRYAKLMQKILSCPAHVITCSRAKTEWSIEDKNGKSVPTKVGLGTEGDKQMDYEYTVSFMIQQGSHIASVDDGGKDNTGLYDGKYEMLTEADGEKLYEWANSGSAPAPEYKDAPVDDTSVSDDELKTVKAQIVEKCKALGGTSNAAMMDIIKEYSSNGNPNAIKDIAKAKELLNRLDTM